MRRTLRYIGLLIMILVSSIFAQDPIDFYPHNVGDRWEYYDIATGTSTYMQISKDSIGADGSHNLFYNNFFEYPQYSIDSSLNVFWFPEDPYLKRLYYKLPADIGDVWITSINTAMLRYAWVVSVDSAYVFSKLTKVKVFRYGPSYPDSANSRGLLEDWLAEGYGLIYSVSGNFEIFLRGCVINGDTSGIVTTVVSQESDVPSDFTLRQNYPNPFNPSTQISYQIKESGMVNIKVYNVLGKEVATLVNEVQEQGAYSVLFDASELAAGVYIYSLRINNFSQSQKMLLLK